MKNLIIQPGIMDIAPYSGGGSEIDGVKDIIKLSSNESALGASPMATACIEDIKHRLHRYPDSECTELRQTISEIHNVNPLRVICGSGSDELISLICQVFAGPGDEIIHSQYGFLMYPISARAAGATPVMAPESNRTADVDTLLAAVTRKTRILFLANPNNPTGTYISNKEIARLRNGLRDDILLVIDAAYSEYVERDDYCDGLDLVEHHENVVMTRTFSKIYGLGGLRLGWAYCPKSVVDVLHRVRGPFNVNSIAQAAGIAVLKDEAFTEKVKNHNAKWLPWTRDRLLEFGLSVTESVGNFILCDFFNVDGKDAKSADTFLKQEGIIVRSMTSYGLPNSLRVTIGTESEMKTTVSAIGRFLGGNQK